jgi:hypothetical protein
MFCPRCRTEYREGFTECSDCQIPLVVRLPEVDAPAQADESDLDILIRTGLAGPLAIGLAKSLLEDAGIPFFAMDQNTAARQESGNFLGWWDVRVPSAREAEAREILKSVEEMK